MFEWQVAIGTISLMILWTSSIVGVIAWLNNRFNKLIDHTSFTSFVTVYERRHSALSNRLYNLELWATKKNGFVVPFEKVNISD